MDNTNTTRAVRGPFIDKAKRAGYRMVCCFFDVPVRAAIRRNNHREDKRPIPVPAILRGAKQLEAPLLDEGFDEIRMMRTSAAEERMVISMSQSAAYNNLFFRVVDGRLA
jgi:predicted kinase